MRRVLRAVGAVSLLGPVLLGACTGQSGSPSIGGASTLTGSSGTASRPASQSSATTPSASFSSAFLAKLAAAMGCTGFMEGGAVTDDMESGADGGTCTMGSFGTITLARFWTAEDKDYYWDMSELVDGRTEASTAATVGLFAAIPRTGSQGRGELRELRSALRKALDELSSLS